MTAIHVVPAKAGTHRQLSSVEPVESSQPHDHRMEKHSYVYLLASGYFGTLYIGVTSNLIQRVWQHREGASEGFTKTYGVKRLVWYECHDDIYQAITREKQIKQWNRAWKVRLIQERNPRWHDLYDEICG